METPQYTYTLVRVLLPPHPHYDHYVDAEHAFDKFGIHRNWRVISREIETETRAWEVLRDYEKDVDNRKRLDLSVDYTYYLLRRVVQRYTMILDESFEA